MSKRGQRAIGQKYTRLTVTGRAKDYVAPNGRHYQMWHCKCDCGNESTVLASHLLHNKIKSCGCARIIDLAGQKFEMLTVICRMPNYLLPGGQNQIMWKCRCECGKETVLSAGHIGVTKSCGCLRKLQAGEAAKNRDYGNYSLEAKRRKLSFGLSKDDFVNLCLQRCFYCNSEPRRSAKARNGCFIRNGIDRVDNTKGYSVENCVPCCATCNYMKRAMGQEEFLTHVNRIADHTRFKLLVGDVAQLPERLPCTQKVEG